MTIDAVPTEDKLTADPVSLLVQSPYFDAASYARLSRETGSVHELAHHYLTAGEAAGLAPSAHFDPKFYLALNPDVKASNGSPLLHFIRHGQSEHRYPTRAKLRIVARTLEESGLFDGRAFAANRSRPPMPGLTPAEDYLVGRDPVSVGDAFDNAAYGRWYGEETGGHMPPLLHYLDIGLPQNRVATVFELQQRMDAIRPRFNDRHYMAQLPPGQEPDDPLEHYVLYGAWQGYDPEPLFSPDYYLRRYPDMQGAGMDPYYHFVVFGLAEGRLGVPDFTAATSQGLAAYDADRPTILVASHEASRTGAPLVGLNVGACLAATHNVIAFLGRGGSLLEDFRAHSCLVVTAALSPLDAEYLLLALKQTHGLSAVLLNSVETSPLSRAALYAGLPSVALVHEFAEYTLPVGRMSSVVESVDRVVVPAGLIKDSLEGELRRTRSGSTGNIRVRHQGCLPELPVEGAEGDLTRDAILATIAAPADRKPRIVLGAGFVQMRKGVDLFVQAAAETRKLVGDDVRFVWVGDGYHPGSDLSYSAWVADMVRRLQLERVVFFLPSQSSLDLLFEMADVFFLPSRLDPFPNVVLDAFTAGRAVVCFEGATGAAGVLSGEDAAVGAVVPYCNVQEAASALAQCMGAKVGKRALANADLARTRFAFADYMADLGHELAAAAAAQRRCAAETARVEQSGLFDAAFHAPSALPPSRKDRRRAIQDYVAQGMKGLMQFSPRPGFNEGLARTGNRPGPALGRAGAPAATHRCIVLDEALAVPPFPGRVALHIHMHYPDLAGEFLDALVAADCKADLFVTTPSDEKSLEVAYGLRKYKGGRTRMIVAPNRGRDIGPFLTEMGPIVQAGGYDLVGHLHGKRSVSTDGGMGDRWRRYLLGCLLGGKPGLGGVLAAFTADPALGLLFAEDRHVVGWTDNLAHATALAARMQPQPVLPDWPVFPLGNMFWARPAALQPLWRLGLTAADFPAEPVAYDGTVLHAIERMLPAVCESAGLGWATVFRTGLGW